MADIIETKLETNDNYTMGTIFNNNSFRFIVPLNQRKYDWEEEQIEDFWNDLHKISKKDNRDKWHYLGVISLIEKENSQIDYNDYKIIDGQQRIITTSLLIAALRDFYYNIENKRAAEKIHEKYLLIDATRGDINKLESCKIDSYTFNNYVNIADIICNSVENIDFDLNGKKRNITDRKKDKYINKNIVDAYNYFYEKIKSNYYNHTEKKDYLFRIEEAIKKLQIIMVISKNKESLFLFFNSLNNRGLQLNQMDIIRNDLLEIVQKKFSENSITQFSYLWDDLVIILNEFDSIKFLKYYFICVNEKIFFSKQLPDEYKKYFNKFNNKINLEKEIEKMIKYANIYVDLFNTSLDETPSDKEYERNIKRINSLGQQACHSFLMDYFYYITSEERRNNITKEIESMMFKRIINKSSSKKLDGIFRDFISSKSKDNKYKDNIILNKISSNSPNKNIFEKKFINKEWKRDNITNYTLRRLENKLNEKYDGSAYVKLLKSRKNVNIEHVMPEEINEKWSNYLSLDDNTYKLYRDKIGNLVLLEEKINKSIKNKLYREKKIRYKESSLNLINELLNKYNNWTKEIIDKRTKDLKEIAIEIWY